MSSPQQLISRYPILFTALTQKMSNPLSERGIEIDHGWMGLLFLLSAELNQYNIENNRRVCFSQVKEKLGRLTCYLEDLDWLELINRTDYCPEKVEGISLKEVFPLSDAYKIIEKYESISTTICYQCGSPTGRIIQKGTWIISACSVCEEKK